MYHYVRDGARVHARTTAELDAQLDFVLENHEAIGARHAMRWDWPEGACMLTFDDGLVEHLETVAPALERRGLTGVFAVPARPVLDRVPLDVQKTQFLLAASDDLGAELLELAAIEDEDAFRSANTPPHRYDPPETVFVKRALQDGLPEGVRRTVLDALFHEHVTDDERGFADSLYLTLEDCRELVRNGHEVIGHGDEHRRMGLLPEAEQRREIERSRELVEAVGGTWAFCYPYGSRDGTTLRLLREAGCPLGLTTDVGVADANTHPLLLPRLDTNDLPKAGDAPLSEWTLKAMSMPTLSH